MCNNAVGKQIVFKINYLLTYRHFIKLVSEMKMNYILNNRITIIKCRLR